MAPLVVAKSPDAVSSSPSSEEEKALGFPTRDVSGKKY
jgi:hypothetical protein